MISIIVPCRNEAAHIRGFLDNLARLSSPPGEELEFVIADGMSSDGTREALLDAARRDHRVRLIDNAGGIVSTGLNAAIRASRGERIVRMDVHAEYAADYVIECMRVLEETGAANVGGPPRIRSASFLGRAIGAAFHSPFAVGGSRFHDLGYEGPADTVCFGAWRRETLEACGLFDEELVRNQDDELNFRLIRRGGTLWQSRRIVSWYVPRSSLRSLARQYFQYGFWKVAVIRKHRRPASLRHLVPSLFAVFVAAGAVLLPLLTAAGLYQARSVAAVMWWSGVLAYVAASAAAALHAARTCGTRVALILPVIFAVYHLSYGMGFLYGMWRTLLSHGIAAPRSVTSLSR